MADRGEIYKCSVCGLMVEVLISATGHPVCCSKPMERLEEKTRDEGKEKHVPAISHTDEGIWVRVGSVPHPMEEQHYIQWIEINADGVVHRKFLSPGDVPEAKFPVKAENVTAREHCNVHGLWKS
jgi:superoxide reductase